MKKFARCFYVICMICQSLPASPQDYHFPVTDWPFYLQHHNSDTVAALNNFPRRGYILDRKGRVLAMDSILYDLVVKPGLVKKSDEAIICRVLNITQKEFKYRIQSARDREDQHQPRAAKTPDRPAVFKGLLSKETAGKIFNLLKQLRPAFSLEKRAVRHYPYDMAAQVLGYVKAGNVGETGLEQYYDSTLRGTTGLQFWQTDTAGHAIKRWSDGRLDVLPENGHTLYTTIDISLQALAEKLLKGKRGSLVALNPATGGILAMASSPAYSPTKLALDRNRYFPALLADPGRPLFNRVIGGINSPGSVFKLFQALIGLEEGVLNADAKFYCAGGYTYCGKPAKPKCHVEGPHRLNLTDAIAMSCNSYFADLFLKILGPSPAGGLSRWSAAMQKFGFGLITGIDLPGEKPGRIPDTSFYKHRYPAGWNGCTIISDAIGQGEVSVTVLQLATAISIIANKGWYYTPHLVDSIEGMHSAGFLTSHQRRESVLIHEQFFEKVQQGMYDAVNTPKGTAYKAGFAGLNIYGKTGTVENNGAADHSVFAGFAPGKNPKIVVVCLIENGGFGAEVAAPIAGAVIKAALSGKY